MPTPPEFRPLAISGARAKRVKKLLAVRRLKTVRRIERNPFGLCYWNVKANVEEAGGDLVLGWQIDVWAGKMAIAMHHAVWRSPDGELFCVTGQAADKPQTDTLSFADDDRQAWDGEFPPNISSIHIPFGNADEVAELQKLEDMRMEINRQIVEVSRSSGARYEPYAGLVFPPGPVPQRVEELGATRQKLVDLYHQRKNAILLS